MKNVIDIDLASSSEENSSEEESKNLSLNSDKIYD